MPCRGGRHESGSFRQTSAPHYTEKILFIIKAIRMLCSSQLPDSDWFFTLEFISGKKETFLRADNAFLKIFLKHNDLKTSLEFGCG